ncbi:tetratricopeptide repeat protein [Capnocytophaga cynodegmi]|uniref:tetratricopeptide repeat protein n=1 Tax=Capnocytophaga cynodegmi TaxID=28189 RepID=UPI00385B85CB
MDKNEINKIIKEGVDLFKNKKYEEAIEIFQKVLEQSIDIEKKLSVLYWLGRCYFEKKDFDKATDFFSKRLVIAENEQKITEQLVSLDWLGQCYFEKKDFNKAINFFERQLAIVKKKQNIAAQLNCLFWLGQCYFEKKDFDKAINFFERQLALAEEKQNITGQLNSLHWLGYICFKQGDFDNAIMNFEKKLNFVNQEEDIYSQLDTLYWIAGATFFKGKKIENEALKEKAYEKSKIVKSLVDIHLGGEEKKKWTHRLVSLLFPLEKYDEYFDEKKTYILKELSFDVENRIDNHIASILAVLNVFPRELRKIPLAHYTSPIVCENLFGLKGKERSNMRMGSSTYMNDPTEGNVLLELLNQQDLELDNKRELSLYNAFFACFSTRVNDLNQFRLYGKEDGVEASGCCLVLNKERDWLQDTYIASSYRPLVNGGKELSISDDEIKSNDSLKLPLYQVAYIAYLDEYIRESKCEIKLTDDSRFGVLLNKVGDNEEWHEVRKVKLQEALDDLIEYFKTEEISEEDKSKLEYIRYLFKDFAFRDEEEFRLMQIEKMDSDKIKYCKESNSIYVPYSDITNMVDEVILGTNYEKTNQKRKVEIFRYQMKDFTHIQISHSSLPINANLPYRKE